MNNKKLWQEFEEEIAEYFDGKRQPGSGNKPLHPGDVRTEDYLIECKFTEKDFYSLHISTWEKICYEARNKGLIPLFACRSKKGGDFFLGNQIDFLDIEKELIDNGDKKSIIIKNSFSTSLKGKNCNYDVVCWEIDWDD